MGELFSCHIGLVLMSQMGDGRFQCPDQNKRHIPFRTGILVIRSKSRIQCVCLNELAQNRFSVSRYIVPPLQASLFTPIDNATDSTIVGMKLGSAWIHPNLLRTAFSNNDDKFFRVCHSSHPEVIGPDTR